MATQFIAVISPAKLLDANTHYPEVKSSHADYLAEAEYLVSKLKKYSTPKLAALLEVSTAIADENVKRFREWHLPFDHSNAVPAILMFKGDVYRGMQAETFSAKELDFAQKHVRILSGLYGIVRPLDLIQPYRLMMGTPFSPDAKHKHLYAFWQSKVTAHLDEALDKNGILVNLASSEYFKAIDVNALGRPVVQCEFKEKKNGKLSIVSTYAKLARGKMAGFIVRNGVKKIDQLQAFNEDGYNYEPSLSNEREWVFVR